VNELPTNRWSSGLFPNDADGNAWAMPSSVFRRVAQAGYKLIDPAAIN